MHPDQDELMALLDAHPGAKAAYEANIEAASRAAREVMERLGAALDRALHRALSSLKPAACRQLAA